jgi:predicted dehydrogenase
MKPDRRSFLLGAAAAGFTSMASAEPIRVSANDEIRVAILGSGWRGGQLAEAFSKTRGCRLVAFADPDAKRSGKLADIYSGEAYTDLRNVFDDPNVDAVAISTCNHWHCLATIWALNAGKDVYVEKPLSHTQWEGRQVVNAAAKSDRIVAFGTQQRSDPMQTEVKQFLHENKSLGEIKYAQANRLGVRESVGKRKVPLQVPPDVDYNLWLGPAANQPIYRDKLHYDWHWDFNTGGGEMGNWGVHILDDIRNVAYLDTVTIPKSIVAAGGRVIWNDGADTPNVHFAIFETDSFPTMITISNLPKTPDQKPDEKGKKKGWSVRAGMPVDGPSSGYVIACEGGYYFGERQSGRAVDLEGKTIREFEGGEIVPLHVQNFINAVRDRDSSILNAPIEMGHHSTSWANLANIGFRSGQAYDSEDIRSVNSLEAWPLLVAQMETQLSTFGVVTDQLVSSPVLQHDPETETFVGEHAALANRFLKRQYRKNYTVPKIS